MLDLSAKFRFFQMIMNVKHMGDGGFHLIWLLLSN